jgi:hypothetical protein
VEHGCDGHLSQLAGTSSRREENSVNPGHTGIPEQLARASPGVRAPCRAQVIKKTATTKHR